MFCSCEYKFKHNKHVGCTDIPSELLQSVTDYSQTPLVEESKAGRVGEKGGWLGVLSVYSPTNTVCNIVIWF